MRIQTAPLVLLVIGLLGCGHHADLTKPATQDDVGVEMAHMNLWREAMFRFQRAVKINPSDALAHNNLAVAYEANGDFEAAAREYREALRLDRSNTYIQKNYSRYTEFMARSKKRAKGGAVADKTPVTPASAHGQRDSGRNSPVPPPPGGPTANPGDMPPMPDAVPPPSPTKPPGGGR